MHTHNVFAYLFRMSTPERQGETENTREGSRKREAEREHMYVMYVIVNIAESGQPVSRRGIEGDHP